MLIDTHAHLTAREFKEDLEDVIHRALENGVERMVTIATTLEDSLQGIALAENYPQVFCTVGIHPTSVEELPEDNWLNRLRELATHERVVALGEIGLDYYHPPREGLSFEAYKSQQRDVFTKQLQLAAELNMNVVIHQRDSWKDTLNVLTPFHGKLRAVFHCFTGTWQDAQPLIDHNHLLSFTGIVSFKNAREVHETVRQAPLHTFMVETDAPYLAPTPHRGKRCEPAFVRHTAEAIALLKNVPIEKVEEDTTLTAEHFFKLPH